MSELLVKGSAKRSNQEDTADNGRDDDAECKRAGHISFPSFGLDACHLAMVRPLLATLGAGETSVPLKLPCVAVSAYVPYRLCFNHRALVRKLHHNVVSLGYSVFNVLWRLLRHEAALPRC
jgi:hypothetical protein